MTTKKKTTLVLGAGASCGYGFPVGSQLRDQILALRDSEDASQTMLYSKAAIREFTDAFQASQAYSIDLILGRRPEFMGVGKAAIAYILLNAEQSAILNNPDNEDHWYQYLLHELTADVWSDFDPSWLSVVTFNYDRSFEQYLVSALMHSYNLQQAGVVKKLKDLQIAHVYGQLGDPFNGQTAPHIPFGGLAGHARSYSVTEAAKGLVIIPEGRDDSVTITRARSLISAAEQVCFLGFGFDATNIRRLGAPESFTKTSQNVYPNGRPKKTVATCLGMTQGESRLAISRLFGPNVDPDDCIRGFQRLHNCIRTLRETLILN